jgi:hypothetical protein
LPSFLENCATISANGKSCDKCAFRFVSFGVGCRKVSD